MLTMDGDECGLHDGGLSALGVLVAKTIFGPDDSPSPVMSCLSTEGRPLKSC